VVLFGRVNVCTIHLVSLAMVLSRYWYESISVPTAMLVNIMGLLGGCLGMRSAGGVNAIVCWITRPQFLHTVSPVVWSCRWFVVLHSGQGFVSHNILHLHSICGWWFWVVGWGCV